MWRLVLILLSFSVIADNQQNGDLNSNTQDSTVNSNNTSTSKTYNGAGSSGMPVVSAISPSLMSSGNDSCLRSQVNGIQLAIIGITNGTYLQDKECNRRKDAKTLKELGMSIAAVALMCQNTDIWLSMFSAGTPCPLLVNSKLVYGKSAYLAMRRYPEHFIPSYRVDKEYYDRVLQINEGIENEELNTDASITERFRTSIRD
jgi:hypothetical protein